MPAVRASRSAAGRAAGPLAISQMISQALAPAFPSGSPCWAPATMRVKWIRTAQGTRNAARTAAANWPVPLLNSEMQRPGPCGAAAVGDPPQTLT
ncbi:Hypothetical predicted protein [Podarcis lilfordi]|uniref:Uncharacterized protein n=1 Tax=Podarcis lilfordi TaxID=74358 RepID=A0AA35KHV8_9SAUR|nr:Hypothetical predicted protein [Podarcis lilfordi]